MNKKMTVSTFTTQYINCKKESARNSLVRSIIKRSYVPVTEKVSIIQELLVVAFDEKDGLKIPNALCLHINFHIIILSLYTDLEIDKKENDTISVSKSNFSHETDEVNVMISDTYPLSLSQLPEIKKNIPTLLISRNNTNDVNRYDSPELVRCVVNEVRSLNNNIKKVNVYATTKPLNTKNIASSAFKLGGRDNFNEVRVFQQERDGIRKFNNKGIVVYKR